MNFLALCNSFALVGLLLWPPAAPADTQPTPATQPNAATVDLRRLYHDLRKLSGQKLAEQCTLMAVAVVERRTQAAGAGVSAACERVADAVVRMGFSHVGNETGYVHEKAVQKTAELIAAAGPAGLGKHPLDVYCDQMDRMLGGDAKLAGVFARLKARDAAGGGGDDDDSGSRVNATILPKLLLELNYLAQFNASAAYNRTYHALVNAVHKLEKEQRYKKAIRQAAERVADEMIAIVLDASLTSSLWDENGDKFWLMPVMLEKLERNLVADANIKRELEAARRTAVTR